MLLSFAPGEAYQIDWSDELHLVTGATVVVTPAPWAAGQGKATVQSRVGHSSSVSGAPVTALAVW